MLRAVLHYTGLLKRKANGKTPPKRSKACPVAEAKETAQGSWRSILVTGGDEASRNENYEKIWEGKIVGLWDTIFCEVQANIFSVDTLYHIYKKATMAINTGKATLDDLSYESKEIYVQTIVKEMEKSHLKPEAIYIHIAGMMTSYTLSKLDPPLSLKTEESLIRQSIRGMAAYCLGRGDLYNKDLQKNAAEAFTLMLCSLLREKPSTACLLRILGYFNACIDSTDETMRAMAIQSCIPLLYYAGYLRNINMKQVKAKIPPLLHLVWTSLWWIIDA
ncbi:uncharacterized protein LOC128346060 isoform X2 [Hemicordylus capensis]|uniref:uncharacterized protein LOC128346060 isoform X2 n=1 Tax=Hemicordylus capensis TaxID=884348 RepID=UPI00230442D5|nr:uncharacterized protein LOC128346060 isoform X2 [Hemicordylus capensis]